MLNGRSRSRLFQAIVSAVLLVSAWALDNPLAHAQASSTAIPQLTPGLISTVAGDYYKGSQLFSGDGGPATSAQMWDPEGLALDSQGNLYIADSGNNVIRAVNMQSTAITILGVTIQPGDIQTVIGSYNNANVDVGSFSGDGGPAGQAGLGFPVGLAFDNQGNLYFADSLNSRIRVVNMQASAITVFGVTVQPGDIETIAGDLTGGVATNCANATDNLGDGCPATQTALYRPTSTAFDSAGNLYIADSYSFIIRKVSAPTGIVSLVAGTGTNGFSGDGGSAVQAELFDPNFVQLDANGNVYIADLGSNRVRVVNTQSTAITLYGVTIQPGAIETVAGSGTAIVNGSSTSAGYSGDGGPANQAHLDEPSSVWLDPVGDLYIADSMNEVIRKVNAQSGIITTVAGSTVTVGAYSGDGGPSTAAQLNDPYAILLDAAGDIFIADQYNEVVRKVDASALALNFPDTYPGSVSQYMTVTFENIGGAAMTLSAPSLGGTDPTSFGEETNCPTSLASGDSCTFNVSFEPATSGPLTANLSINESSPSASQSIVLNGTGSSTVIAEISVSSTQLNFASQTVGTVSASQSITVTNAGTAALSPSAAEAAIVTIIGPNAGNFTETNNCGNSLPAGTSCIISVSFAPQAPVSSAAFLIVQGNGENTPLLVSLSGTGTNTGGVIPSNPPLLQVIPGTISTIVGDNVLGYTGDGGPAIAAELYVPDGVSADAHGNLFVSDLYNQVIRYVNFQSTAVSPDGITVQPADIVTIAGDGVGAGTGSGTYTGDGGPAIAAGLDEPAWNLLDQQGNLYFVDYESATIRVINTQPDAITVNGVSVPSYGIQTVAGKGPICSDAVDVVGDGCPAVDAILERPGQIAMDAAGNLYIADTCHQVIRAVNMRSSTATIAGVSIAPGQIQIIAGTLNAALGDCGMGSGTFAGDGGPALSAKFYLPMALAVDAQGNIYVGDSANWRIRAINTQSTTQTILGVSIPAGAIETVAGNGTMGYSGDFGPATAAEIVGTSTPQEYSVALDPAGNLYLADHLNNVIREIFASNGIIRTVAGNGYGAIQTQTVDGKLKGTYSGAYAGDGGAATSAELYGPNELVIDAFGNLDISDGTNSVVRQVTPTPAGFNFPDTQVGTTSVAEIYTFSNISTQSIAFSGIAISPGFKQVASGLIDCTPATTLLPAGICQVALAFAPSEVGLVTGTAVISDTAGVQTIALSGTGTTPDGAVLQAIMVSPANPPSIEQGSSQQFVATGDYSDGSTQTITSTVVWASSMTGVASFGATPGLATGVSPGMTQITATMGNIASSPVALTVTSSSILTSQTITVTTAAPASAADNSTFPVAATASSGLPVSIASTGACTGSGTGVATITMTAASGVCTVTYTQAGNGNYAAAPAITSTTAAALASQTITVTTAAPASAADNSTFPVAATASSSLPVSIVASGACSGSGSGAATITMTAASGVCTVTYTQAGNGNYAAASTIISTTAATSPVPAITMLNPSSAAAGSAGFTLTVTGTNFVTGSVVNFNGVAETTAFVSGTQVTATIPASTVASVGTLPVTVTNPAPGGGTSNSLSFTVTVTVAPGAALSPNPLTFPSTVVNTTAAAMSVTLTNPGNATLSSIAISITGTNASQFALTTGSNACATTLMAGASCSIYVTFTPVAATSYSATLQVSDNASGLPQTVTLNGTGAAAPSFTISSSNSSQSVQPGAAAEYTVTVAAQNGTFSGTVALTASGVPAGATALFSPASVTPGSSSAISTMTIQTAPATAAASVVEQRSGNWPLAAATLPLLGLCFARRWRRRWITLCLLLITSLGVTAALSGCGGGFALGSAAQAAQTYTITVTGISGSIQQSTTVQLTVQ